MQKTNKEEKDPNNMKIVPVEKEGISSFIKSLWEDFGRETGEILDEKDFYFAVMNSEKIGYLHINVIMGVAYLEEMILKSEFRNRKIGHQMMEFFERFAVMHSCHKMRMKTCPERNPAAFHLYKKLGFIEEAWLKNDYFNKDWVILSKFIRHN